MLAIILAFKDSATSTSIVCDYNIGSFTNIVNAYYCNVNNEPNIITLESAQISSISGTHSHSKIDDDVGVFWASSIIINFFPKDLLKFFKNLKGIIIYSCQLKEIHQADLKPFVNLISIRLQTNSIEIIEEGLFDYNPHLELVEFNEPNIIHIDANVFDNLSQLKYFWFQQVPCIAKNVDNSRDNVLGAIRALKNQCVSSEFSNMEAKIKNLQIESESLNFETFKVNLNNFENTFENSKFLKFRPLSERLENLKLVKSSDIILANGLKNITSKLEDLKSSKCVTENFYTIINNLETTINEIKTSQKGLESNLVETKASIVDHGSKLSDIQSSQNQLKDDLTRSINTKFGEVMSWQNSSLTQINDIQTTQAKILSENTASKSSITNSLDNLTTKFNDHKSKAELSQDEIKGSINDMEASISNVKASQNEVKSSLIKLRTSQNEIKIVLDEFKAANSEDKLTNFGGKLDSFERKLETIEEHFMNFEVRNADKIDKELANTRHKMALNLDEKLRGIEKRLMSKFEEVLEEKFKKSSMTN